MGILERHRSGAPDALLVLGTRNGGRLLGFRTGEIAPGEGADLIAVDPEDLSLRPHGALSGAAFLANLVHSGSIRAALTDVFVGGEPVVRERRLVRVDEDEIAARVRRLEMREPAAPAGERSVAGAGPKI
jgi:cytosine/adenosine deaminase-related metal-dependent hydrolase